MLRAIIDRLKWSLAQFGTPEREEAILVTFCMFARMLFFLFSVLLKFFGMLYILGNLEQNLLQPSRFGNNC